MSKTFKWVIEIEVNEVWIADGFNIIEDDEIAGCILDSRLSYAHSHEVKSKILSKPDEKEILKAQGY